jgi:hypothetical protein
MKLHEGYYAKPPHENLINSTSIGPSTIPREFPPKVDIAHERGLKINQ